MEINKNAQGIIIETNNIKLAFAFNKKGEKEFIIKGKAKDVLRQLNKLSKGNSLFYN